MSGRVPHIRRIGEGALWSACVWGGFGSRWGDGLHVVAGLFLVVYWAAGGFYFV